MADGATPPANPQEAEIFARLEAELGGADGFDDGIETVSPEVAIQPEIEPVPPPPVVPAVVPPVAPAAVVPVPPVPAVEDEDEGPSVPTKPKQIRLSGQAFHMAALLKQNVPPAEALRIAYGDQAAVPPVPAVPPTNTPAAPEPTAQETRLAEIREELAQRAREGSVYDEAQDALQNELAELTADIRVQKALAARDAEAQAAAERARKAEEEGSEYDRRVDADLPGVVSIFGEAGKEGGTLYNAIFDRMVEIAEDKTHPFHEAAKVGALMPTHVMYEVATKVGATPQVSTAAPSTPPATTVPAGFPVPGSARTTPAVPHNAAQAKAALAQALASTNDPAEKARILGQQLDENPDDDIPDRIRIAA
jgi:hypothetical protein